MLRVQKRVVIWHENIENRHQQSTEGRSSNSYKKNYLCSDRSLTY